MGTSVNTKPSSGAIYPGIDIISFGSPVEQIRVNAKKLSRGSKAYMPKITDIGKSILTKQGGNIVRFNAATKRPFKSMEKTGVVKSIVSSPSVKSLLERLFARKYPKNKGEDR